MCPSATPQINHDVSPDSMLILHAAEEVVSEDGFDELLEGVRDRVDEIESLHRTRELTVSRASTKLLAWWRIRPRLRVLLSALTCARL